MQVMMIYIYISSLMHTHWHMCQLFAIDAKIDDPSIIASFVDVCSLRTKKIFSISLFYGILLHINVSVHNPIHAVT